MLNIHGLYYNSFDWFFRAGLEYPVVLISVLFAIFAFGTCWGSFLNVCIWRIPLGESVVVVPSHCPKCNHKIRWYDNVPVIGFITAFFNIGSTFCHCLFFWKNSSSCTGIK